MTQRALLLAGVCLGLLHLPVLAQEGSPSGTTSYYGITQEMQAPAWAGDAVANAAYDGTVAPQSEGEYGGPIATDLGAGLEIAAPGDAPKGESGVSSFYGESTSAATPAWAAEATFNPEYAQADAAPDAASEPAAAPAEAAAAVVPADPGEAPKGVPGVTSYYGDTAPSSTPAWAAEATMNPDYGASEPASAQATAAADPGEAPKGVPGVTSYYGDTKPATTPAWAAEATMTKDQGGAGAATSPQTQAAVEACRDALNAEAKSGILFASNSWDLLRQSYKTLDKLAKIAKDCDTHFVIEIGGHTDNVGSPAANQKISDARAQTVLSYLTGRGVPAAKLKAVGYGQSKPVADNGSAEGRAKNRRIEFLVTTY